LIHFYKRQNGHGPNCKDVNRTKTYRERGKRTAEGASQVSFERMRLEGGPKIARQAGDQGEGVQQPDGGGPQERDHAQGPADRARRGQEGAPRQDPVLPGPTAQLLSV